MRNFNRVIELMVLSGWVTTFFTDGNVTLIRCGITLIGLISSAPRMYSGIVRRERAGYPTLSAVLPNYSYVNLVASRKDEECLVLPGLEAISDPSAKIILTDKPTELGSGRCNLIRDGQMPGCPYLYVNMSAYQVLTSPVNTSIPCVLVDPKTKQQTVLRIS